MDERLKFIARVLDGEKMAGLCREFGISRKTGYKILTRYNEIGLEGLTDRSRRPYRHANQLPFRIETQIVRLKAVMSTKFQPRQRRFVNKNCTVARLRELPMNRSCQRRTTGLALPDRRMISLVPQPSAVARMIRARHTCFCGALRSRTIASSRARSARVTLTTIPALIPRA
jgi:Helix-turn-helix domain